MRSATETDALFEIAVRLDDASLLALYRVQRDQIQKLFGDNSWWRARTESAAKKKLADRDANWSKIYYALLDEMSANDDKRIQFQSGLDYLPSFLVLEEVYGTPEWEEQDRRKALERISSPEVLEHALSVGLLDRQDASGIEQYAKNGWTDMLRPIYLLMKANSEEGEGLEIFQDSLYRACILAIENNHPDALEVLVPMLLENAARDLAFYTGEILSNVLRLDPAKIDVVRFLNVISPLYSDMKASVKDAIVGHNAGNADVIQLLVDQGLLSLDDLDIDDAVKRGRQSIISFLVDRGYVPDNLPWDEILEQVSLGPLFSRVGYVAYLLTKTSPAVKDNRALKIAVQKDLHGVLDLLLKDARLDPMDNIRGVLESGKRHGSDESSALRVESTVSLGHAGRWGYNHAIARILEDDRVRVELMDLSTLRLALLWRESGTDHYGSKTEDKIRAYTLATGLSSRELGQRLEQSDLYAMLLRFILVKLPDNQELVDWMIEQDSSDFQIVATSILTNRPVPAQLLPFEVLLLCALYPIVSMADLQAYTRRATSDPQVIRDTDGLLALHLAVAPLRQ